MNHSVPIPNESQSISPWTLGRPPERVLVIRFHAIGDVALVLPAAAAFRELVPASVVDLLTMNPAADLAGAIMLFHEIIALPVPSGRWERAILSVRTGIRVRKNRYDVVIDLQRNWMSRMIRRLAAAPSWSEFNRFASLPASERTRRAFVDAGFSINDRFPALLPTSDRRIAARAVLEREGWREELRMIVINPAGMWTTRNWPIENYVQLCRQLLEEGPVQFLLLGTERIRPRTSALSVALQSRVINLIGKTTLGEALVILSFADLMVTEDSGLMHMAWAVQVPILALFGSSRHDWSAPVGDNVVCLHSGDLPCGACMDPTCRYGDVHCLTRYTPDQVRRVARTLMNQTDMNRKK